MINTVQYAKGDAKAPASEGPRVIAHACNNAGGWGKGFMVALSSRWPQSEAEYRRWHRERDGNDFALGAMQLVQVEPELWVANLVGRHGIRTRRSCGIPVRYEAIDQALQRLGDAALRLGASVHMPRIGCGLAGGRWEQIKPLVRARLAGRGVAVTVYDYQERPYPSPRSWRVRGEEHRLPPPERAHP